MATTKSNPVDAYLRALEDPAARRTLTALRARLRALLPTAVETISYAMPTFKVDGRAVAGFAFFKKHCGLYPFSGRVVPSLSTELEGYATSKSGVTFPPDRPLPAKLVKAIVDARLAEIAALDAKRATPTRRARGLQVVGETAAAAFQVGVVRTLPMTASQAWELLRDHPERWLGAGAEATLEPGAAYAIPKRRGASRVQGVVRVVRPKARLRMTWQPRGWDRPATLQITLVPKARSVALHVHMEKLPNAAARESMREHWSRVLEALR